MTIENPCYLLVPLESIAEPSSVADLKKRLEKGDEQDKIDAMKEILTTMSNGDPCSELLMYVIRFIVPEKNKLIKKLLLLYYEACEKIGPDGKLKQEMILVCNAIRNDLQHANEYVRGSTLRFLTKLKEAELLEPLIPSVRLNLEHRHSYVRRNAILAVAAIQKEFSQLIPDASELLFEYIQKETDTHCKRLALFSLTRMNLALAVAYFRQIVNAIENVEEPLQQAILDLIRAHGPHCIAEKPMYLQATLALLSSPSVSSLIKYECSSVLTLLSSNPVMFKAAANCYIDMMLKESDNNVKLIVLDRISDLCSAQPHILQYHLGDLLKVLSSSDLAVVKRGLAIVVQHTTSSTASEIVGHLKKELEKTIDETLDNIVDYRLLLISALTKCAFLSEQMAANVISTLMTFVVDKNAPYLVDCIQFFKLVAAKYSGLKSSIVEGLFEVLKNIKSSRILRSAFWIIGEHSDGVLLAIEKIDGYVNDLVEAEDQHHFVDKAGEGIPANENAYSSRAPKILPDGTYASESAFIPSHSSAIGLSSSKKTNAMRSVFFENGNIYVPASLAMTLIKLLARGEKMPAIERDVCALKAKTMLIIVKMIKLMFNSVYKEKLNADSFERVCLCLRILGAVEPKQHLDVLFEHGLDFGHFASPKGSIFGSVFDKRDPLHADQSQPDALLSFNCLKSSSIKTAKDNLIEKELDSILEDESSTKISSRLDRVVALTAISDPIYAEAYIDIQDLDVQLDIIIVNQTPETFQNVCFEFISAGGNRVLHKPIQATLGSFSFISAKVDFRIHSAEQIILQGSISYDPAPHTPCSFILLNTIALDITYFLQASDCRGADFASLWRVLEWENKIHVKTQFKEFHMVVGELCKITNFKLLSELEGPVKDEACKVFSANLFALSKFGEEVLANVSLEKNNDKVSGHIRIRSKSNGIAYILGTKISKHMGSV